MMSFEHHFLFLHTILGQPLIKNDDDKLCTIPRKLFMPMKEHRK